MKAATLIALIGVILHLLAGTYFTLARLRVFELDRTMTDIMSSLYVIGNIGLLIFFIRLFQKQSN